MEDIVAFVSDDENLTTVVAGVAVVGATIVGGLYASTRETAAQEADSGEKLEQAPPCCLHAYQQSGGGGGDGGGVGGGGNGLIVAGTHT